MVVRTRWGFVLAGCAVAVGLSGCGGASTGGGAVPSSSPESTSVSSTPTEVAASDPPSSSQAPMPTFEPPAAVTSAAADVALTVKNSKSFAALLKVGDYCDESVAAFANDEAGKTIEFDASIAAMSNHDGYSTRYDILVAPGNKGPESSTGPAFQFRDVNIADLNLQGSDVPDTIGVGDRIRVVALVGEYNPDQCLLFLEPVSTTFR